jgi:hypothetical protein
LTVIAYTPNIVEAKWRSRRIGVKELLRTNERVFLSWAQALLAAEEIEAFVMDGHMSVLEGSANAIPVRLMVADADYDRARRLFEDAGEGDRVV